MQGFIPAMIRTFRNTGGTKIFRSFGHCSDQILGFWDNSGKRGKTFLYNNYFGWNPYKQD